MRACWAYDKAMRIAGVHEEKQVECYSQAYPTFIYPTFTYAGLATYQFYNGLFDFCKYNANFLKILNSPLYGALLA